MTAVKLNYAAYGEEHKGTPVILMHGLFGSMANLGLLARTLREKLPVYLIDLRNHGDSPHSEQMDYPDMAADVLALMDDLGLDKVDLVGHSMGGKVAMQLALNHAERVRKIVLADIAPVRYPNRHDDVLAGLDALSKATLNSRAQADTLLQEYVETPEVRSFLLKNLARQEDGRFSLKINLAAIVNHYADISEAPGLGAGGQPFNGPTLFIKGGNSPYIQEKHQQEVQDLFPAAQLKIIPDTGHWLHAEKPSTFNQMVLRFLSESVRADDD